MDKCPICGHEVISKDYRGIADGVIYWFCCKECKSNFEAEPRKYINCCEKYKEASK